jgi:ATP-dependent DNA ligase
MSSSLEDVLKMIEADLATRRVRGGEAQRKLAYALGSLEADDQEVVRRVIGRNLKCGCSDSTVQKIWPLINLSWPCMLVSGMTEKTKLKFPIIAQTKMDGMRFNAVVEGGAVTYRSRSGKELDIFGVLDDDFLRMAGGEDLVFDGELLVWGTDGKPMDRKTGNGLLTKFQKETGTPEIAKRIRAMVWDRIPLSEFHKGSCQIGYSTRLLALNSSSKATSKVQVLKTTIINSISIAQTLYQEQLAQGEEGIILKDPEGIWENKRVKHQVKMKAELEADLLVTGFTPGTGKYEGKIGSLEVQSADGKVKTSVGTGMSDEERSLDFKEFVGRIVAVKYNALISDKKTGALSVFLPVFVEVREDKTVADIL